MNQTCRHCSTGFEITDSDLAFYEKVSPEFNGKKELISPPTLCPQCRRQRRHAHRNERNLYHRKCDLTGQQMISVFAPERDVVVYNHKDWWSDQWDAHTYGRDFDFSKKFFPQFAELMKVVPNLNVSIGNVENSDYCHLIADCKNCYLLIESSHCEDCLYSYWLQKCTDCCDASFSHECTRCCDIDNCYACDHLLWSRNCLNCSDSAFLLDCIGCKNCLLCVNLRQKEYCILNVQYTKEEYEQKRAELDLGSRSIVDTLRKQFEEFSLKFPRKYMTSVQTENCTGNYIQESKNCIACFHAHQAEDCKYGEHVWRGAKDGMDVVTFGRDAELMYETTNTNMGAARVIFSIECWSSSDIAYSFGCRSSNHCFGCVNMQHTEYCIFNKQYTKEQYEELAPKIIEHMRKTGEWGEFFPAALSVFGYDESVAQEYFPLSTEEIQKRGWKLSGDKEKQQYLGPKEDVPDSIRDVTDDWTKKILTCEKTGKLYKVIPQELKFYRDLGIPLPKVCPDERHSERMALRNPLQLWNRECAQCEKSIQTTYAPDRPEIVYCEDCYLSTVY